MTPSPLHDPTPPFTGASRRAHPGPRSDGVSPLQRRVMAAVVAGLHVALAWGLLQVKEVREAVAEAAPIFVSMVAPPAPAAVRERPQAVPSRDTPAAKPLITAQTRPAEPAPSFSAAPPESPPPLAPVTATGPASAPAPATPRPAASAKTIPPSAVQYLEAPVLVYPRASRRAGEAGRVLLRVYIDEAGLPRQFQVSESSGFARLDEAAIAAVQTARFKPCSDNGQPTAGWALVPLSFDLEK